MDHLEEFELDNGEIGNSGCRVYLDLESWAEALATFPNLQKKIAYVTLTDEEVLDWAACPPPSVKSCRFETFDGHFNHWKGTDPFPGLRNLTIWLCGTGELVDWPLRNLIEGTRNRRRMVESIDQADFAAVRMKIKKQNLKVTIHLGDDPSLTREDEPKVKAELEFWKTVKNAKVSGFQELVFGSEDPAAQDDGAEE